ncbi:hypothetical protein BC937DRAFT_86533 [Endogone sp. FLAS-F59071]|nr:hypothetical protein BC937DRAFT_86533 [Endogone sp. FLAS-F59071]|eukprot:RUS22822.1 hypothetical protein BC937DRAFT_86533 [Endogone sp. FLAS-F59071]
MYWSTRFRGWCLAWGGDLGMVTYTSGDGTETCLLTNVSISILTCTLPSNKTKNYVRRVRRLGFHLVGDPSERWRNTRRNNPLSGQNSKNIWPYRDRYARISTHNFLYYYLEACRRI